MPKNSAQRCDLHILVLHAVKLKIGCDGGKVCFQKLEKFDKLGSR